MKFSLKPLGLAALFYTAVAVGQSPFPSTPLAEKAAPLKQVGDIVLPQTINGAFDHVSLDSKRGRLFLAAEDAGSVLVVNLPDGKVVRSIPFPRPHDVFYRADNDRLYVTAGADGALRIFEGRDYQLASRLALDKDADALGYDPSRKLLYVVNGATVPGKDLTSLSVIDADRGQKLRDVQVKGGAQEGMALDAYRPRLYLNDRGTNEVVVFDRYRNAEVARWRLHNCDNNVAMALDEFRQRLFVGCRTGNIAVLDTNTGQQVSSLAIHKGVNDLIYDPRVGRLYASSDGYVDTFDETDLNHYRALATQPTESKAGTAVLSPQENKLLVAVPKGANSAAHILIFAPQNTLPPHPSPSDVKEPVSAPVAEEIVLKELSAHPTLRRMGLHVIPPGQQTMILIANGNQTRLGIHTSEGDFQAVKSGGIYGPRIEDGQFFNMKMPMFDGQHRRIGILVMEIPCTDAADEEAAAKEADSIRAEVAAQIPDLPSLFAPNSR